MDHILVTQLAIEPHTSRVHVGIVTECVAHGFAARDLQHTDAVELVHLGGRPDVLVLNLRQPKLQIAGLHVSIEYVLVGSIALHIAPHDRYLSIFVISPREDRRHWALVAC